jgi:3-deoxy-D-manno-octulosonate 8-phosphate phosphatase (KDO 8-P phosphatase)
VAPSRPPHPRALFPSVADGLPDDLVRKLAPIRLLCLDMDGVLTDGHLYFQPDGSFSQRFCVRDGYGLKLLQSEGVEIAILSGGDVLSGRVRAQSLGIRHAHFGIGDKVAVFHDLCGTLGLSPAQAAFIGDELADIPLLQCVGFAATVPDAVAEVRACVHYITMRPGGDGAVREVADYIRHYRTPSSS